MRLFKDAIHVIMEKPAKKGSVSSFQALVFFACGDIFIEFSLEFSKI